MRSTILSKKAVLLGLVVAVAVAATAFAFLTAEGSGSGSGTASATAGTLALTSDAPAFTQLDQTKTVKVYATNSGANPLVLSNLTVSVDETGTCPQGSFSVVEDSITETGTEVPAGTTTANKVEVGSVGIRFNNVDADQAPCLTGTPLSITLGS